MISDGKRVLLYPMKTENDKLEQNNNHTGRNPEWQKQTDSLIHEESIAESGRIFIRNLPFLTTEEELQTLFEKYGTIFIFEHILNINHHILHA